MCGITGFWISGRPPYEVEPVLESMIACVRHRGPDDEGSWIDRSAGICLGHTRLSVIELSAEGYQPMQSASGRFVLTYNGEVFNYEELRRELDGFHWRGHSDTEVMLAAFEQWGVESAVARFNGQFALAVWDAQEQTLTLVRDRLGIKPLYWGRLGSTVLFASELKSIARHPAFTGDISPEAAFRFLELGFVPGPLSIFEGVRKLPPGHIVRLQSPDADGTPTPFWSLDEVVATRHLRDETDDTLVDQLESLLGDAVRKRMIADVPLGAFLSGGIDSSLVVALMQHQAGGRVKTFSIGFDDKSFDEAPYAEKIARHLGTDHTTLYVSPEETFDLLAELPSIYDEPFADEAQIPVALVSRLARQFVTVSLSGDGGDEFFGGYDRYGRVLDHWRRLQRYPEAARRLAEMTANTISSLERTQTGRNLTLAAARRMIPTALSGQVGRLFDLAAARDVGTFYRQSVRLDARSLAGPALHGTEPVGRFDGMPHNGSLTDRETLMLADGLSYLPDDILVNVDRASMDRALEVRVPLLDHRVVEFSWSLPERMKYRDGATKWILRMLLARYVPTEMFERPKHGFAVPLHDWLRGPLREWSETLLDPTSLSNHGFVDPKAASGLWRDHLAARGNAKTMLWRILTLEAWKQSLERDALSTGASAASA